MNKEASAVTEKAKKQKISNEKVTSMINKAISECHLEIQKISSKSEILKAILNVIESGELDYKEEEAEEVVKKITTLKKGNRNEKKQIN